MTETSRTYKFHDSYLTLTFGDITTSDAEVLVSSDDYKLTMSGGVSRAIRQAGGNAIPLDAAKMTPATLGDVVVTTAGTLPARYIFHAVTIGPSTTSMTPSQVLQKVTKRCLQFLEAFGLQSIAFPAIGAGTASFPYEEVAAQMSEVIADDLLKRNRPVKILLYLYDPLGRKQPMDYIRFFEEFAARTPKVAAHESIPPSLVDQGSSAQEHVFVSYSHKDKVWLKRLQDMLKPLVRQGTVSLWSDTDIKPGATWRDDIERELKAARAAVLLVSPNFLASDFIAQHELPPLLDKAKNQGTRILWAHVSSCLYKESGVGAYQAAHDVALPLDKLKPSKRNEVLVQICQKIREATNQV
ncbi:MAG: putative GTPase [Nitrospira sp.]|nr:MAG: putative GTPase [Nitrospira sp.]